MKLNYKRTFFVGLAFLSICAFWQLYDNLIPLILDKTFGLGETATGVIMALDNGLALFMLPLFGAFSDKVNTRMGKRTPFIIAGTGLAVVFMMLVPYADQTKNFALFFVALGILLIAMGSYRTPAVALMPDLTPKPLRSKANAVINLMGAVGGIFTLQMIKLLVRKEEQPDYTMVFVSVAVVMVLAVLALIFTIKENALRVPLDNEQEKGIVSASGKLEKNVKKSLSFLLASVSLWFIAYNAVTTAFSRYAINVWGLQGGSFANCLLAATGAAIVSYIPIGIIASRIGRKKMILIGIAMMTLSYLCGFFFVDYSNLIYGVFAFTGIGWAAISVNSYPMVVEMSRGSDVGKYTGYYYTFSMAAQILTPILSGFFLEHLSYRILFPYALLFSAASFCTMLYVKHGDSKPPKKGSALQNFDIED